MYGLIITIGILLSIHLAELIAENKKLTSELIWKVAFRGLIWGVIGARLFHVASEWELYAKNPMAILFVWNGGLGIFGGIFGGLIGVYLATPKKYFLDILDIFASVLPLGQALGRWGNYFNGELLPYAIYESFADIVLFIYLQTRIRKISLKNRTWQVRPNSEKLNADGSVLTQYLIGYALIRLFLDKYHNARWIIDEIAITRNFSLSNFNIIQTIAILILVISLILLWKLNVLKKQ